MNREAKKNQRGIVSVRWEGGAGNKKAYLTQPGGCRQLWQILKEGRKRGRCSIDTSSEVTWDLWVWDSKVISTIKLLKFHWWKKRQGVLGELRMEPRVHSKGRESQGSFVCFPEEIKASSTYLNKHNNAPIIPEELIKHVLMILKWNNGIQVPACIFSDVKACSLMSKILTYK